MFVNAELIKWLSDNSEAFCFQEVIAIVISGKFVPIEKITNPITNLLIFRLFNISIEISIMRSETKMIKITPTIDKKNALIIFLFST